MILSSLKNITKQLLSLLLPITVLIVVPLSIEQNIQVKSLASFIIGLSIICFGLFILVSTISTLTRLGNGTLAPWSPTSKLVIYGLYRYVRNPMILAVIIVLIGESVSILSFPILIWTGAFFIINNIYFFVYEEPNLKRKFGKEYEEYRKNVHRWIPRFSPYKPNSN